MANEKLVFGHAVQGIFLDALGERLNPQARVKFREAGIDLDRPLLPAYDQAVYHRCIELAAAEVWPELPRADALRRVGAAVMKSYEGTLVGKAVAGMIRMIGPRRTLERATHNFRSATNYLECKVLTPEPRKAELTLNETSGVPTYFEGVVVTALEMAGATHLHCLLSAQGTGGTRYRLTWEGRA